MAISAGYFVMYQQHEGGERQPFDVWAFTYPNDNPDVFEQKMNTSIQLSAQLLRERGESVGEIVTEQVTGDELLRIAQSLGWHTREFAVIGA